MNSLDLFIDAMTSGQILENSCVYIKSINTVDGSTVMIANMIDYDVIVILGKNPGFDGEKKFTANGNEYYYAKLSHENAVVLRRVFNFTAPQPVLSRATTMGTGDRLGIACPGHIKAFTKYNITPVFAQQSMRELNLTGRNYNDVLDSVSFAVYREGFRKGFGADGDHLKSDSEVEYALECGYTMITLDCSEFIHNDIADMCNEGVLRTYKKSDDISEIYLNHRFNVGKDIFIEYNEMELIRASCIYDDAIMFISQIYYGNIKGRNVDFEISIDETTTPTTPLQHFYVSNELRRRGIGFASLAPRFCGEFQKGIDYIGNAEQFARELKTHVAISDYFGYKISVHSGSDKFRVFPILGEITGGKFHIKTAGTSWLEAIKLVAIKDPDLYRDLHKFALCNLEIARQYYHVSMDVDKIPDIDTLNNSELPLLFENNDLRQLIHITYGQMLSEKDAEDKFLYRDKLYHLWRVHADDYTALLEKHIGKHIEQLLQISG